MPTLRLLERGRGNLSSFFRVIDVLGLRVFGRNVPNESSIGQQIVTLRKRKKIGRRQLAQLIGSTQPTIIALENHNKGRLQVLDAALTILGSGQYLASTGDKKSFYTHAGNTSTYNGWETPKEILQKLYEIFGTFDLDPCSPTHNSRTAPVRAKTYFTVQDNGLNLPWFGTVYMNPPYGRAIKEWIMKAYNEVFNQNANTVVGLIPARTDTSYWHDYIMDKAHVHFLRGRLSFCYSTPAPFPSAIVVWGSCPKESLAGFH